MPRVPRWIKTVLWSAVAGSVATVLIGFGAGGWTTAGTSTRPAKVQPTRP